MAKMSKKIISPTSSPGVGECGSLQVKSIVGYTEVLGLDVLVLHQGDPYLWVPHYSQGEPP